MEGILNPKVKVCCIGSIDEAKIAINHGASAVGMVGHMPSGPGVIDDILIREIINTLPLAVESFLLTSETTSIGIISHHRKVASTTIQMVDHVPDDEYLRLRDALPEVKLVQVVHVVNEYSIEEAIRKSRFVDAILVDSGHPHLKIKELGGTGRVHNWEFSAVIRREIDIPLFLAGGLHAYNIIEAVHKVQPYGVDICSGVRAEGKLDIEKLKNFFFALQQIKTMKSS